jgi:RNA polymerase sigma-70 factor (ECF subfamily)
MAPVQQSKPDIADEYILQLLQDARSAEQGFRLLMGKYQQPLYAVIRRIVHQHEDADDVLQNCFISVFRNIHQFGGKSKLYTWLYRIAVNEAITFLNQQKRHATHSLEADEGLALSQLQAGDSPDGQALQAHLQQAVSQLPEKQRIVFEMRYFDEMPYEKIEAILHTSVGALKASYHHAVKKIEAYFKTNEINIL